MRSLFFLRVLSSNSVFPEQFAEIMMKIEEYISKQAKASEGTSRLPLPLAHPAPGLLCRLQL